jgi:hypothetical protein
MEATKQYLITGKHGGKLLFGYNTNGYIVSMSVETDLTQEQYRWMVKYYPVTENECLEWRKVGFKVEQVANDISFAAFWKAFPRKDSKKEAEKAYKLLTDEQKLLAIAGIKKLKDKIRDEPNWSCMYPATYIRQERYLDGN